MKVGNYFTCYINSCQKSGLSGVSRLRLRFPGDLVVEPDLYGVN